MAAVNQWMKEIETWLKWFFNSLVFTHWMVEWMNVKSNGWNQW